MLTASLALAIVSGVLMLGSASLAWLERRDRREFRELLAVLASEEVHTVKGGGTVYRIPYERIEDMNPKKTQEKEAAREVLYVAREYQSLDDAANGAVPGTLMRSRFERDRERALTKLLATIRKAFAGRPAS